MKKIHFSRCDYAAFMVFTAYAMGSIIIPLCLVSIAADLGFPLDAGGMGMGGAIQLSRAVTVTITLLLCGFLAARYGCRHPVGWSAVVMALGVLMAAGANSYFMLMTAIAVAGLGEGVIEGLATPMVSALHPDEPGRYVNFAHSFWAVGLVIATVLGGWLLELEVSWRILAAAVCVCGMIPGFMLLAPDKKAPPEVRDKTSKVFSNFGRLFLCRRFYIYLTAIFLAGGGEFGITFWCPAFVQLAFGSTAMAAGCATAVFALGMIVSRMGAGIFVRDHYAPQLLIGSALAAAATALAMLLSESVLLLFPLLFVAGMGAGPLWPTIQTLCARRLPDQDATMIFILLSASGIPGCGVFSTLMGWVGDSYGIRAGFLLSPSCFLVCALLIRLDNRRNAAYISSKEVRYESDTGNQTSGRIGNN
ncbi:MAG: MFS transporter [Victivallaceae bacterium]|nr:MFS transporter [Victivallaceae bacterium]